MNQPTGIPAPATAIPQNTKPEGEQTAAQSGTPATQANESDQITAQLKAFQEKINTLEKRLQDKDEYIGELSARANETQTAEQQKEQIEQMGKALFDAFDDRDNPSKAIAIVANIAALTQSNLVEQQRGLAVAYSKVVDDDPALASIPFQDVQLAIYREGLDLSKLQKPKHVRELIEAVKARKTAPIDINKERERWKAEYEAELAKKGIMPQTKGTPQSKVDPINDTNAAYVRASLGIRS